MSIRRYVSILILWVGINADTMAQDIIEAVSQGDVVAVEHLLDQGDDLVNRMDDNSRTPLHHAASIGHVEVAELLLTRGADINVQDYRGETPLIGAVLADQQSLVAFLLQQGARIDVRDHYERTALHLVSRQTGNHVVTRQLLEKGANPNLRDRFDDTPLQLAAWRGYGEVVDLLLDAGAEVTAVGRDGKYLTIYAVQHGLLRLFDMLVEKGADLALRNTEGGSFLHTAAQGGAVPIIDVLLERGADINEQDRYGWTPLHYAAVKGRREAAALLIERGSHLNKQTKAGNTALNLANDFDRSEVVRLLEAQGAALEPPAFPVLSAPYLGQSVPGDEPALFAVDIVSSNQFQHGTVTFSPDGKEAYWVSGFLMAEPGYSSGILTTRIEDGHWVRPTLANFSVAGLSDDVPFMAPDGQHLYLLSRRPTTPDGELGPELIWAMERDGQGWTEPRLIEGGPNTMGLHWQFSVAANGNIYFGSDDPGGLGRQDIYVSRLVNGAYTVPENLGPLVNSEYGELSPFIAPDESYIIISQMNHPSGLGDMDLVISFRDEEGNWTAPVGLPGPINTQGREMCPHVTGDGKYLFFNSFRNGNADNYWVSASFIDGLRPKK